MKAASWSRGVSKIMVLLFDSLIHEFSQPFGVLKLFYCLHLLLKPVLILLDLPVIFPNYQLKLSVTALVKPILFNTSSQLVFVKLQ